MFTEDYYNSAKEWLDARNDVSKEELREALGAIAHKRLLAEVLGKTDTMMDLERAEALLSARHEKTSNPGHIQSSDVLPEPEEDDYPTEESPELDFLLDAGCLGETPSSEGLGVTDEEEAIIASMKGVARAL